MEPTSNDVSQVQSMIDANPAPPAPTPQSQPPAPTPQPAPTSQPAQPAADPFAALSQPAEPVAPAPAPTQPTEPTPTPQPSQPVEPSQPTPSPAPAPQAPAAPDYQSFDDYMKDTLKGIGEAPAMPDAQKINPEDPEGIKKFFDELVNTAVVRAKQDLAKSQAIQNTERRLWDAAFDKYGSLRGNQKARDLVHNIRMGYFQKGVAITPIQAADILLESMGQQYRQGVADNQVHTTIEQVQPNAGGGTNIPTTLDKQDALVAVQTGGEQALAEILDQEIKAGRL